MTDCTWWNSYFTIHDALEGDSSVTEFDTPTAYPEIDLEEYWIRRYFEITGRDLQACPLQWDWVLSPWD